MPGPVGTATADKAVSRRRKQGVKRRATTAICGASKGPGKGLCQRQPGWGTDHLGAGKCKLHGGSTATGRKSAAVAAGVAVGNELGVIMGSPLDVEPHEALLSCVQITAGEVAYMTTKVRELQSPTVKTMFGDQLDIWIKERQKATERLAKFAKLAIDAGVEERRVRLAERYGETLANLLRDVLSELKLTPAQQKQAPKIVRRHLVAIEGTAEQVAA